MLKQENAEYRAEAFARDRAEAQRLETDRAALLQVQQERQEQERRAYERVGDRPHALADYQKARTMTNGDERFRPDPRHSGGD